jgi:hypothetical protein
MLNLSKYSGFGYNRGGGGGMTETVHEDEDEDEDVLAVVWLTLKTGTFFCGVRTEATKTTDNLNISPFYLFVCLHCSN